MASHSLGPPVPSVPRPQPLFSRKVEQGPHVRWIAEIDPFYVSCFQLTTMQERRPMFSMPVLINSSNFGCMKQHALISPQPASLMHFKSRWSNVKYTSLGRARCHGFDRICELLSPKHMIQMTRVSLHRSGSVPQPRLFQIVVDFVLADNTRKPD